MTPHHIPKAKPETTHRPPAIQSITIYFISSSLQSHTDRPIADSERSSAQRPSVTTGSTSFDIDSPSTYPILWNTALLNPFVDKCILSTDERNQIDYNNNRLDKNSIHDDPNHGLAVKIISGGLVSEPIND